MVLMEVACTSQSAQRALSYWTVRRHRRREARTRTDRAGETGRSEGQLAIGPPPGLQLQQHDGGTADRCQPSLRATVFAVERKLDRVLAGLHVLAMAPAPGPSAMETQTDTEVIDGLLRLRRAREREGRETRNERRDITI